mmetsp:Transcript_9536/g.17963  ORF Transcript_9536/g.17963 Transcript_9536/m.17963 type:complete len:275 (+) Transcript_9536:1644-2468(+)
MLMLGYFFGRIFIHRFWRSPLPESLSRLTTGSTHNPTSESTPMESVLPKVIHRSPVTSLSLNSQPSFHSAALVVESPLALATLFMPRVNSSRPSNSTFTQYVLLVSGSLSTRPTIMCKVPSSARQLVRIASSVGGCFMYPMPSRTQISPSPCGFVFMSFLRLGSALSGCSGYHFWNRDPGTSGLSRLVRSISTTPSKSSKEVSSQSFTTMETLLVLLLYGKGMRLESPQRGARVARMAVVSLGVGASFGWMQQYGSLSPLESEGIRCRPSRTVT